MLASSITRSVFIGTIATATAIALIAPAASAGSRHPSTQTSSGSLADERGTSTLADRMNFQGAPPETTATETTSAARNFAAKGVPNTKAARLARKLGAQPCEDGSGGLCGQFMVPRDYRHPSGPMVPIDFMLLVHTKHGAPTSTIWWNGGGPGPSTTRGDGWVPGYLFGDLLPTFDVLLTDTRGTGSTAPACPSLQDFAGYLPGVANHAPIADCAASIADRIGTYGSATSARDLNGLRKALEIPKLDIVGNSYGSMPATAFAVRYPKHTRSVVISSGVDVKASLRSKMRNSARGFDRILTLLCTRSPACSRGVPQAQTALAAGVRLLHKHPLEGEAESANNPGVLQHVRLTEGMLFNLLEESDNTFMSSAGEVPAALIALRRGDELPALRLAADATDMFNVTPYDVPAEVDSAGGYYAIQCSDYQLPWPQGVSLDGRIHEAAQFVQPLDSADLMGAWNAEAIVRTPEYADWQQLINCNRWPDVELTPVVPEDATYPNVPALVLTSSLDPRTPLEDARRQAARWPNSQLLNIGGALHGAALWACGPQRVQSFIAHPGKHQAPCSPGDFPAFRAVGEFPLTAGDATPLRVDRKSGNATTKRERKLVAVALETALDANSVVTRQYDVGERSGLRGGSTIANYNDTKLWIKLVADRFAADVAVSGRMIFPFDGSMPTVRITFAGDDGSTGRLRVNAELNQGRSADAPDVVPVRGTINGHRVALLLPL